MFHVKHSFFISVNSPKFCLPDIEINAYTLWNNASIFSNVVISNWLDKDYS